MLCEKQRFELRYVSEKNHDGEIGFLEHVLQRVITEKSDVLRMNFAIGLLADT